MLLIGDSHVARIRGERLEYLERTTKRRVINVGVGGAKALDLLTQLPSGDTGGIVVVSIGTNDAAPWKQTPLAEFTKSLEEFLDKLPGSRLIYIPSPGVVEERLTGPGDRTNELIQQYTAAASELFAGGVVLETPDPHPDFFESDGVHLNTRGYSRLLAALQKAISLG